MKIIVSILFILSQLAAASVSDSAVKCGSLGVMSTDHLPEGIISGDVRTCADHPLGHKRTGEQSLAPMSSVDLAEAATNEFFLANRILQVSACQYEAPYGCSGGYCWGYCPPVGAGTWCWLAANNGYGDWLRCATWDQCDVSGAAKGYNPSCGNNCKEGSKACGCNCDH